MRLSGFYLRFGEGLDEAANRRAHAKLRALLKDLHPAVTDLIPGYASLYVEFDEARAFLAEVRTWAEGAPEADGGEGRQVEVPVVYDGPDLAELARWAGLSEEEVVRRHAGRTYRVFAIGFTPGFPFMAEVDPKIAKPRRPEPRKRVPAHSVGIAGRQTGVYPQESPGGWNLIGRTRVRIFDPHRERPFFLEPGDRVRFLPEEGPVPPPPEPLELIPEEPRYPVLEVLSPGLLDLPLDDGRFLAGRYGLARSGPADPYAARVANRLVGNLPGAPVLEFNLAGPELLVLKDAVFAFAGFGVRPRKNGEEVPAWTSFFARAGDRLAFPPAGGGMRGYLAVAGGFALMRFFGSASVDLKGRIGRPLKAGDRLGVESPVARVAGRAFRPRYRPEREVRLRLRPGPQASAEALAALTRETFEVADADRMGVRLAGAPVPGGEVTSEGVPLGAVQVPPSGKPILLLADRGTLGGYQKPALLLPEDLPKAAQLRPGDRVRFVLDSAS